MEIEDLDENEFVRDIDRFLCYMEDDEDYAKDIYKILYDMDDVDRFLYCMKNRIEEGDLVFFNCDEDSD